MWSHFFGLNDKPWFLNWLSNLCFFSPSAHPWYWSWWWRHPTTNKMFGWEIWREWCLSTRYVDYYELLNEIFFPLYDFSTWNLNIRLIFDRFFFFTLIRVSSCAFWRGFVVCIYFFLYYCLENTISMFIWIGLHADQSFISQVFGVNSMGQIDIELVCFASLTP